MRVSLSIAEKDRKEVMKLMGAASQSAAVRVAVEQYLRQQKIAHIQQMVRDGRVNYAATNEEIEAMWSDLKVEKLT